MADRDSLRRPGLSARQALEAPVSDLAAVDDKAASALREALQIETIRDLADSPLFEFAREVVRSSTTPGHSYRRYGVPADRVARGFAGRSVRELPDADLSALGGLDANRRRALEKALGVSTIRELGSWPAFVQARELVEEAGVRSKVLVEGRVLSERGAPTAGVVVRLYQKGFGGERKKLAETKTNEHGFYSTQLVSSQPTTLEIWAVTDGGEEVALSGTKFLSGERHVIHVVAPASLKRLEPELDRLTADVGAQLGDLGKLAQARERAGQRDLTLLHRSTGWDARLLALAAKATALAKDTGIGVDALYGLFRVGLPTDSAQLAQLSGTAIEKGLKKAVDAGIVRLSAPQLRQAKKAFSAFAQKQRLAVKAPGTASSYADFMAKAGLTSAERAAFEDAYFHHRGDGAELWRQARERGIPEAKVDALRLQGKLGYLTLNSAPLASALQAQIGSVDQLDRLVDGGLYDERAWQEKLRNAAGDDDALQAMIPTAHAGTLDERLEGYAADLARKVRLSFPTQVVATMIGKDELRLGADHAALKAPVQRFFKAAKKIDPTFELGRVALDAFARDHEARLFAGASEQQVRQTMGAIKTIQRVYQITPSNESMKVLLEQGFTSAQDVIAFGYQAFVDRYGPLFPSLDEARLVYRKAEQVTAVTYSFFTAAQQLDTAPGFYALSPPVEERERAKAGLIDRHPTMASLFGSLDFCECEHCRSVLSPAAYLVDLLQFLEHDERVWESFLADWRSRHGGEEYQREWRRKPDGSTRSAEERKPYDALLERRPDLVHLPLTCENTHTALPYIDLVNEILEYFVAEGRLAADASRDTGSATTPELLAEPQNIVPTAYEKLNDARYPLNLPFDLWLETVRGFLARFEVSLADLLEAFRTNDALLATEAEPYGHQAVFVEALGLSPAEHAILTRPDPLTSWHELYGFASEAAALAELKSAKRLSRRLGVSYRELIQLVECWLVNPNLDALGTLRKLDVEPSDVFRYHGHASYPAFTVEERAAFEARLDELTATYEGSGFNARDWLQEQWRAGAFDDIVVLADPSTGCNFDETTLRYADGRDADAIVFHKMNLLVRLWRRLGWSLDETDRALQALVPKNLKPVTAATMGAGLRSALVYLSHLEELEGRLQVGKDARQKLATLWSDLPTRGERSLYAQLFLSAGALKHAPELDHPLGLYLSDPSKRAKHHLPALQAATGLTAEEITQVLLDVGADPDAAPLSLEVASTLYRHGLLARALKLSVRELLALKSLSGLDPFKPLDPEALTSTTKDHPFVHTLPFVDLVEALRGVDLKVADLEYLLQHVADPVGAHRVDPRAFWALFKTLSAGLRRIDAEHTLAVDPLTLSDDLVRQKLSLVLSPDVVEPLLGMWTGVVVWLAGEDVAPASQLDAAAFAGEPDVEVRYDAVLQRQLLSYRGVLLDSRKAELTAAHPSALLARLLDQVQEQSRQLFTRSFVDTGLFRAEDYDVLFGGDEQARRTRLAHGLLPFVRSRLATQHIAQSLVAELNADPALIGSLALDENLVSDPSEPGAPLRDAFHVAGTLGVSAAFFPSADASGVPSATEVVVGVHSEAHVEGDAGRVARPAGTNSALFEGYLEVPVSGAYRFFTVAASGTAEAELSFEHLVDPVLRGRVDPAGGVVELTAGIPYRFRLFMSQLADAGFSLEVQGHGLPRDNVGQLTLYPATLVERVRRAHVVLSKTVLLVDRLGLTEREVRHLLTHRADFADLDVSRLPTEEDRSAGPALFSMLRPLLDYVSLKRRLGGTDDLIQLFRLARRSHPAGTDADDAKDALAAELFASLAELGRREPSTVSDAALALGLRPTHAANATELRVELPAFVNARGIARLWDVLELVEKLGASPSAAARWATPAPDFAIAEELKSALRAQHDTEGWQRVAQSVFDKLRARQRDALVSFIDQLDVFQAHFVGREDIGPMEKIYEFFLIDPGMEPVVQTSRLLLATASVQLFIQRCLLNLEPHVDPSTIDARHWEWMKRYRVWEANRKIWLFPENWLEPEFRDDKTHLFQELEGALLQEDLSEDSAEDAFFTYLKKLEALARLDIVALYADERPLDPDSNTLHVVGRTHNQPHQYFYRQYAHQMWTPWEPVDADIEGDHIAAVMWRGRLHLFWLTFLDKADDDANGEVTPRDMADKSKRELKPPREVQVQLSWSAYSEGQWTTREGGGFGHLTRKVEASFDPKTVFVHVSKELGEDGVEGAVRIHLSAPIGRAFRIVSKNSPPEVKSSGAPQALPYSWDERSVTAHRGAGALDVTYVERVVTEDGEAPETTAATRAILHKGGRFGLLGPGNGVQSPSPEVGGLVSPFFYQDNRHTFFVEPTLQEVTVEQWEEWVIPLPPVRPELEEDWWFEDLPVDPFLPPRPFPPEEPGWVDPLPELFEDVDPDSLLTLRPGRDWATDPATLLQFDEGFVGRGGSADPVVTERLLAARATPVVVDVDAGGAVGVHGEGRDDHLELLDGIERAGVTGADVVLAVDGHAPEGGRVALDDGALNLITGSGLGAGALSNLVSRPALGDGPAGGDLGRVRPH